ncbi:DUF5067 domain-containing protein [Companilactobacillus alimentarius]|uniref:DUF5067 domain-containing protein n=1 Tax=Companilactobacillus alimentarius TaxID=1602 RepID=UPI003D7C7960
MKNKGLALTGLTILLASTLVACSSGSDTSKKSEKPNDVSTKTVKKSSKKTNSTKKEAATKIPTDDKHEWFFKDDVFYAGMETYKLTKSEIRDGIEDGTKVLVIYTDVTNNSKKEQDPSNVYMVVHAKQKNETSNVELNPGMVALDAEGNNPLQQYEDNLYNNLLPGKTVTGVLEFEIDKDNTNPVTVEFDNSDFDKIGTKTYQIN